MFVIFSLTVVGVVHVDMEKTWTTLICKYGLALYLNHGSQKATTLC